MLQWVDVLAWSAVSHVTGCMDRLRTLPLCFHSLSLQVSEDVSPLRSKGAKTLRHPAGAVDKTEWAHPHVVLERMRQGPRKQHHLQWHLTQPRGVRSRPRLSLHGCTAPAGYPSDSNVGPRKPGGIIIVAEEPLGAGGRSGDYRYTCNLRGLEGRRRRALGG